MADFHTEDTIAAIATPIGEGGISVIRLSGPKAFEIAAQATSSTKIQKASSHSIHLESLLNESGQQIDQILVSLFRAPNSYTGDDVVELSGHGGMVVTRKILERLIALGARHADPGEFTKRAFLNGKIDLTQAEAVLDLIKAKSERSALSAMEQLSGSLSNRLGALKDEFMTLYAHLEAYVDFPEDHLEVYKDQQILEKLETLESEIESLIASFTRGNLIKEGISAAIVGKPNVGKSSLFNALLERDRAIVSEHPGTTRDRLEEAIEVQGIYIRLMDTAGLASQMKDPLDRMGMQSTRQALEQAQLYLYVVDGSSPLDEGDKEVLEEIGGDKPYLVLMNKCDLPSRVDPHQLSDLTSGSSLVKISTVTREGLDQVEKKIADKVFRDKLNASGEQVTRLRHKNGLERSLEALKRTKEAFHQKKSIEFVTEDLKESLTALKELVGEVYSEDLLDVIFSEFCIGK